MILTLAELDRGTELFVEFFGVLMTSELTRLLFLGACLGADTRDRGTTNGATSLGGGPTTEGEGGRGGEVKVTGGGGGGKALILIMGTVGGGAGGIRRGGGGAT